MTWNRFDTAMAVNTMTCIVVGRALSYSPWWGCGIALLASVVVGVWVRVEARRAYFTVHIVPTPPLTREQVERMWREYDQLQARMPGRAGFITNLHGS